MEADVKEKSGVRGVGVRVMLRACGFSMLLFVLKGIASNMVQNYCAEVCQ